MTRNRIDAIEAAVERVTEAIGVLSVLSCDLRNGMRFHQATTSLRGIQLGEALAAHIDTALIALAEANERASLLQTALAASEARLAEAYRLGFEASGEGWNGGYPFEGVNLETSPSEHALAWRKGRAGDLNPQQEGSRDHG